VKRGAWRVTTALAASWLTLAAMEAAAHAYLQRSEPPANAVLQRPPAELRLRYSEAVEPSFLDVRLLRAGQPVQGLKLPQVDKDGKTVRVALPSGIEAGDYEVRWRIVAKDGHPTEGRLAFRIGAR
jgi:methionine-rich copper-binding protein CopC